MATKKLVRQADGTLVEMEVSPGQELAAPAPEAPPVTPRGAAAQGASPDSAKMSGTPAQKGNALAKTVDAAADLGLQERQVGAAPQLAPGATETATRAKELAGGLSALGSYGARVQGLIKARLDQVGSQSTGTKVDEAAVKTALAGQPPEKLAQAQQALTAYAATGSEADLAKIRDLLGTDRLAAGGLERLYVGAPEQLAQLGKTGQGAVTIGQLDLAAGGMNPDQLATDLGVDKAKLLSMTPDEFQQAVQDTLNRELSSVDALRAEYRTASPTRQAQILEQLRTADASGLAAIEASTEKLVESMERAEQVQFAGRAFNIQDLLKSDRVSDVIRQAATNDAALAQLQASEPDLAAWVVKNKASLRTFAEHSETQRSALEATQGQAAALLKDLTPELRSALSAAGVALPAGTMTAEQLAGFEQALKASPLYQAMQADPAVRTLLQQQPGLADRLKDMPADQVQALVKTTNAMTADADLAAYLGIDTASGVLDPAQAATAGAALVEWGKMDGALRASPALRLLKGPDGLRWANENSAALLNPDLQALVENGTVATSSMLDHVVKTPAVLETLKSVDASRDLFEELLKTPDSPTAQTQMMTALFGAPMGPAEQQKLLNTANVLRNRREGHEAYRAMLKVYDVNRDGKLNDHDFSPEAIASRLRTTLYYLPSDKDVLSGDGKYIDPLKAAQSALGRHASTVKKAGGIAGMEQAAVEMASEARAKKLSDERERLTTIDRDLEVLKSAGDKFGVRLNDTQAAAVRKLAVDRGISVEQAWREFQETAGRNYRAPTAYGSYNNTAIDFGEG
jgi:hypothetical protein